VEVETGELAGEVGTGGEGSDDEDGLAGIVLGSAIEAGMHNFTGEGPGHRPLAIRSFIGGDVPQTRDGGQPDITIMSIRHADVIEFLGCRRARGGSLDGPSSSRAGSMVEPVDTGVEADVREEVECR